MATIAKIPRANGVVYKAIIRKDGRVLKTKTFNRKTDAKLWAQGIESDNQHMEALRTEGARMILDNLAEHYVADWSGKDPYIGGRVAFWTKYLGTKKLVDITAQDIRGLLKDFAEGRASHPRSPDDKTTRKPGPRAPSTVNRLKVTISSMFTYAMRHDWVTQNPARRVPQAKLSGQRCRFLNEDERSRLLQACRESDWHRLYLLVLMALTTGARKAELMNLHWSDIDFGQGLATLNDTKNGDPRILPLPNVALEELKNHREIGSGLVFPSRRIPSKPFEFRKQWERALADSGIKDFRFHDLRHSAASYLVMAGATLHEAAEVLGHRSVATTKRYAHLSTKHKVELVERVLGGVAG